MVIGGPYHPARAIGSEFAPGFQEVIVRRVGECDFSPCPEQYEREFRSTSGFWESLLNGFIPWLAPPILVLVVGLTTRPLISRSAGYVVAMVRFQKRRDGLTRFLMLIVVAAIPIMFLTLYWLLPPDPVQGPPGV
jgi:ABC-type maltose transport system permease subunit